MSGSRPHIPVLFDAVRRLADVRPDETWVDCTLGFGGHARGLLEDGASRLIGIDQDHEARHSAERELSGFADRFQPVAGNFRNLQPLLTQVGHCPVDGILADIGVSSFQLDSPERGFSFRASGPVDMRMDQGGAESAESLLERLTVPELAELIRRWGEEPFAGPIARAIKNWLQTDPIRTTDRLAKAIENAIPPKVRHKRNHHPATKTFQALRIAVNDELGALEALLDAVPQCLAPGGRFLVITFHSLEDRMVKRRMNQWAGRNQESPRRGLPAPVGERPQFELLSRRPVTATVEEIEDNPRARSAKLRAVRRVMAA